MKTVPVLFEEKQRFTQVWVWLILLGINGLFAFAFFYQIIGGKPFGDKPMSDSGLMVSIFISLVLSILFYLIRLETVINEEAIYVRFFPLQRKYKKINWDNIEAAHVRTYSPIREYGGWGLRMGAYNISGNKGLQLELKDGSKLLIGTNKTEELETLLTQRKKS